MLSDPDLLKELPSGKDIIKDLKNFDIEMQENGEITIRTVASMVKAKVMAAVAKKPAGGITEVITSLINEDETKKILTGFGPVAAPITQALLDYAESLGKRGPPILEGDKGLKAYLLEEIKKVKDMPEDTVENAAKKLSAYEDLPKKIAPVIKTLLSASELVVPVQESIGNIFNDVLESFVSKYFELVYKRNKTVKKWGTALSAQNAYLKTLTLAHSTGLDIYRARNFVSEAIAGVLKDTLETAEPDIYQAAIDDAVKINQLVTEIGNIRLHNEKTGADLDCEYRVIDGMLYLVLGNRIVEVSGKNAEELTPGYVLGAIKDRHILLLGNPRLLKFLGLTAADIKLENITKPLEKGWTLSQEMSELPEYFNEKTRYEDPAVDAAGQFLRFGKSFGSCKKPPAG